MKKHNFSAGPSILAPEVFQKASEALLDFEGTGLSVIEISHRSPEFVRVIERARALALEIAGLDDSYTTLFLQGGASMQFLMVPYNLLETKYVVYSGSKRNVRNCVDNLPNAMMRVFLTRDTLLLVDSALISQFFR